MNSILRVRTCSKFRVNEPEAAGRWDELVARSPQSDVCYRAAYVLAAAELEHSQPLAIARADRLLQQLGVSLTDAAAADFQPPWAVLVRRQHSLRLRRSALPEARFRSYVP